MNFNEYEETTKPVWNETEPEDRAYIVLYDCIMYFRKKVQYHEGDIAWVTTEDTRYLCEMSDGRWRIAGMVENPIHADNVKIVEYVGF